jgi:hypothetical protein
MIARLIFRILTRPILAACHLLETPLPPEADFAAWQQDMARGAS